MGNANEDVCHPLVGVCLSAQAAVLGEKMAGSEAGCFPSGITKRGSEPTKRFNHSLRYVVRSLVSGKTIDLKVSDEQGGDLRRATPP